MPNNPVATISGLYVYPVKGCKGIALQEAELAETGLVLDRHWMVVDRMAASSRNASCPRMALISTGIEPNALILNAPGLIPLTVSITSAGDRLPVTIWSDRCVGIDQGQAAADWLSAYLQLPLQLVCFDRSTRRDSNSEYTSISIDHCPLLEAAS